MAGHLGTFEQAVLLALVHPRTALGREGYGRAILKEVQHRLDREIAAGAVYATLDRLERKGYVTSMLGEPTPERGGRAKRYFQITAKGVKEVRDAQRMLTNMWRNLEVLEGEPA